RGVLVGCVEKLAPIQHGPEASTDPGEQKFVSLSVERRQFVRGGELVFRQSGRAPTQQPFSGPAGKPEALRSAVLILDVKADKSLAGTRRADPHRTGMLRPRGNVPMVLVGQQITSGRAFGSRD